jgi:hypothetical protein
MDQENQNTTTAAPNPADAGGQPASAAATNPNATGTTPAVKPEDILRAVGFERSPEEERELIKRKYDASTKEALRYKSIHENVSKMLAEQGVELLVDKDGKFQGLKANDKYSSELPSLKFSFEDLTAKEKELFAEEPEKAFEAVVNRVLNRAQKAFTRVQPTVNEVIDPMTDDKFKSVIEFLATRKDPITGDILHADVATDAELLKMTMQGLPEDLQKALFKHPDIMLGLLHERVGAAKRRLTSWAERQAKAKAEQESKRATEAQLQPAGAGQAVIQEGSEEGRSLVRQLLGKA